MKPISSDIVTVGRATQNNYRIIDDSISETHLQVTRLSDSDSEYLLRCLSNQADGLIVDRQSVKVAKVEKYTPIQLGRVRTTLGDIFKNTNRSVSSSNPLTTRVRDLELNKTHLVGASSICEISLLSPRLAWQAFKLQPGSHEWQIETVHKISGKPTHLTLRNDECLKIRPYHLLLGPIYYYLMHHYPAFSVQLPVLSTAMSI